MSKSCGNCKGVGNAVAAGDPTYRRARARPPRARRAARAAHAALCRARFCFSASQLIPALRKCCSLAHCRCFFHPCLSPPPRRRHAVARVRCVCAACALRVRRVCAACAKSKKTERDKKCRLSRPHSPMPQNMYWSQTESKKCSLDYLPFQPRQPLCRPLSRPVRVSSSTFLSWKSGGSCSTTLARL